MKALAIFSLLAASSLFIGCHLVESSKSSNNQGDADNGSNSLSINLSWSAPTHRINGEELGGGLMGYEIRYRLAGDTTYQSITLGANEPTSYRLSNVPQGEYEIEIAAYDTDGIFSTFVKANKQ